MAYVTTFGRTCKECEGVAVYVVRNRFNADIEYYCKRHKRVADAQAKRLDDKEKEG